MKTHHPLLRGGKADAAIQPLRLRPIRGWIAALTMFARNDGKYLGVLLPLLLAACGSGQSYHEDYGDYEGNREAAIERCMALGFIENSPEAKSCTIREYTRIRANR